MKINTFFFDLGGVLIDFSHEKMCENIAKLCKIDVSLVEKKLFEESLSEDYERGKIQSRELHLEMEALAKKPLDFQNLMDAASQIFSPKPEMAALLEQIKHKGGKLILLSNTCEAHFLQAKKQFAFLELFDGYTLSYEVQARKPEKEIFDAALQMAQTDPSACFYIDDVAAYTQAAKGYGIDSHHFQGIDGLVNELEKRGTHCI